MIGTPFPLVPNKDLPERYQFDMGPPLTNISESAHALSPAHKLQRVYSLHTTDLNMLSLTDESMLTSTRHMHRNSALRYNDRLEINEILLKATK